MSPEVNLLSIMALLTAGLLGAIGFLVIYIARVAKYVKQIAEQRT